MSSPKSYSQIIWNLWGTMKLRVAFICNFIHTEANLTRLMCRTKLLLKTDVGLLGYICQYNNWYMNNTLTTICYNYIRHNLEAKSGNLGHQQLDQ